MVATEMLVGALAGLVLLLLLQPFGAVLAIVLALAAATALFAWKARRALGGQTGDVLGAMQQIAEVTVLLTVLAAAS